MRHRRLGTIPHAEESAWRHENLAATIYHAPGIPSSASWKDERDRPQLIYHGEPVAELSPV